MTQSKTAQSTEIELGDRSSNGVSTRRAKCVSSNRAIGPAVGAVLMGTLSEYLGLRLALALGAIVSGSFWLATRLWHKSMAAGLECSPIGAVEGRPCRPA